MNWKLIFGLSLFGLAMAIATALWMPAKIEPLFWLVIFIVCAWLIAANATRSFFLHGFLVSMVNSVWITAGHVLLYDQYIAKHAHEAAMMANGPMARHPRMMMAIVGPIVGVLSGVVLGLFAWIASKLVKRRA